MNTLNLIPDVRSMFIVNLHLNLMKSPHNHLPRMLMNESWLIFLKTILLHSSAGRDASTMMELPMLMMGFSRNSAVMGGAIGWKDHVLAIILIKNPVYDEEDGILRF